MVSNLVVRCFIPVFCVSILALVILASAEEVMRDKRRNDDRPPLVTSDLVDNTTTVSNHHSKQSKGFRRRDTLVDRLRNKETRPKKKPMEPFLLIQVFSGDISEFQNETIEETTIIPATPASTSDEIN